MTTLKTLISIFIASVFCGCAAHHMALAPGQSNIDLSRKSVALLAVKTSNEYAPTYQFDLVGAVICPRSDACSNPRPYLYKANPPYRSEKDRYKEYLLAFALEPGAYSIRSLATVYQSLWSSAGGYAPMDLSIEIAPNKVVYLGHVTVILRGKGKESETSAGREMVTIGPVVNIELSDSAIVGYSAGTFDIIVQDKFDDDMRSFIKEYPVLQTMDVDRTIMPQWKRPEAQPSR